MRMIGRRPSMLMGFVVAVGCGVAMLKEASYLSDVMTVTRQSTSLPVSSTSKTAAPTVTSSSSSITIPRVDLLRNWFDAPPSYDDDGARNNTSSSSSESIFTEPGNRANFSQGSKGTSNGSLTTMPMPMTTSTITVLPRSTQTNAAAIQSRRRRPPPAPRLRATAKAPPPPPPREMYSVARTDRSGASLYDMLMALAHAKSINATYKGACYQKEMTYDGPNRQADKESLIRILGLQDTFVYACPPKRLMKKMIVPRPTYFDRRYSLLTPDYLDWVRSQMKRRTVGPTEGGGQSPLAVVHVRRGDIDPCRQFKDRYLPSSYYVDILKRYVPLDVPVTVYSESASFENFTEFENLSDAGFNVTIQLDTPVAEVWDAILSASHVVLSRSSFAYIPALLNQNGENATVVYPLNWAVVTPPSWKRADPDIVAQSNRRVQELAKKRCWKYKAVKPGRSFYNASRR